MKMFCGQWSTVSNTTVKSNKLRNENWLQDLAMFKIPRMLTRAVNEVKRTGLSWKQLVWRWKGIMNIKFMAQCQAHSTALYIFFPPIPFPPLERARTKAVK